jgi:hypothetical protein
LQGFAPGLADMIDVDASFAVEVLESKEAFFRAPSRDTSITFLRPEGDESLVFECQVLPEWFEFMCAKASVEGRNTNLFGALNVSIEPLARMGRRGHFAHFVLDKVFLVLPNGMRVTHLDLFRALADFERPLIQDVVEGQVNV